MLSKACGPGDDKGDRPCSGRRSALVALLVSISGLSLAAEGVTADRLNAQAGSAKPITKTASAAQGPVCSVRDKRVCEALLLVKQQTPLRGIVWQEGSTSSPTILAEYEWALGEADVIHLGHTLDLKDSELLFLVSHELAHSIFRHGRETVEFFAGQDRDLPDAELVKRYAPDAIAGMYKASSLRHRQEFAADEFAATVLLRNGHDPVQTMQSLLKGSFSSALHPSKRERIQRVSVFASTWSQTLADAAQQPSRVPANRP
jgi:hypothetical protein